MVFRKSQIEVGSSYDPGIVAILEGGLILVIGLLGWLTQQPLLFASLGPTAYELVEMPQRRSAGVYSIFVGHFTGLAAGFLSLALLQAWGAPPIVTAGAVPLARVFAGTLAVSITVAVNLALNSSQPAACATALVITLGSHQTARDALAIVIGILLITALGQPLRQLRRHHPEASEG